MTLIVKMPVEIIPNLWLGKEDDLNNKHFFKKKKISLILNCSKDAINKSQYGVNEIIIPIKKGNPNIHSEHNNTHIYDYFNDTVEFIHNNLENKKNILVVSKDGFQRAPTIMACYIIKYGQVSHNHCIAYIRSKSEDAFYPQPIFFQALNKFYNHTN